MQAFFTALARKLFLFVFATAPGALGKLVVGLVRPILVAQGVDQALVKTAVLNISAVLLDPATVFPSPDEKLVAEGGAEVARVIVTYFGVTPTEISNAALGHFLEAAAAHL